MKTYRKWSGHHWHGFLAGVLVLTILLSVTLTGCSSAPGGQTTETTEQASAEPDLNEIRSICELATLQCKYHNVARSVKHKGTGWKNKGEIDRKFWIEYQGTVEISFDASKLQQEQNGSKIDITLPEPTITCNIVEGSWNKDSYIIQPDTGKFAGVIPNKNSISVDDQTQAVVTAQKDMEKQVRNNSALLKTAEAQAGELIRNYINQIGELTGTQYQVTIHTTDAEGNTSELPETSGETEETSGQKNTAVEDTTAAEE